MYYSDKSSKGKLMTSAKAIEQLYKILNPKFGEVETVNTISSIVAVSLYRISQEGLSVTEENITNKLSEIANDYLEASKSDVA